MSSPKTLENSGTFAVMALDILTGIMSKADDFDAVTRELAQNLRELTGARTLVVLQTMPAEDEESAFRILRVAPKRRSKLFDSEDGRQLFEMAVQLDEPTFWSPEDEAGTAGTLLPKLDYGVSLVMPIVLGKEKHGALIAMGLMDTVYAEALIEVHSVLSGIIAIIIKNSQLLQERRQRADELEKARRNAVLLMGEAEEAAELLRLNESHLEELVEKRTTELRDTEEQLQQSQKLEAIGQLAGGVAHDFNNLLTVILGYGDALLYRLHGDDPMRRDVEQIMDAGDRASSLTRQLLAFSRKQTLQPEVLDLNIIVRNMEKMLRRLIGENVDLVSFPSDDLWFVNADPGQIEQVIMNLAVNACDAMPDGGKLTIETSNVELDQEYTKEHLGVSPGQYVLMAISDSGIGMTEEVRSKVFEPFFTTKSKDRGTGLGLSTVYGIVKQSGGHVWVYSELGLGATFKIYLSRTVSGPVASVKPQQVRNHWGKERKLLVVEDETALRELLQRMLESLDYKVTVASNGGEALIAIEEQGLRPDLLLTDVVLPGMSGAVLADRLRKTQPDLKVLYMSGYTDNAIVHHGVLDPGKPFIQKPFNLAQLADKIQFVFGS